MIAGVSGIALFVFLFFDWSAGVNAWKAFDIVDVLLAIIALGAVALAGMQALGTDVRLPFSPAFAVALGGYAATVVALTFVLEGSDRKIGLWLSLFAAAGITYGGWRAMHESGGGGGVPRPKTTVAADPIPGQTAPETPPGLAGEPPADGGTSAPGL